MLRVATYNIKHGELKGVSSIADVLESLGADLVALQEVDVGVGRSGGVDQATVLADRLGLRAVFGAAFPLEGGTYGLALLSRHPVLRFDVGPLPSVSEVPFPSGAEPRTMLRTTVLLPPGALGAAPGGAAAGQLEVVVTHLGLDPAERVGQAVELAVRVGGRPRTLVLGDLNEGPGAPAFELLRRLLVDCVAEGGVAERRTYPAAAPALSIDHVLRSPDLPPARSARIPVVHASDHLPVVVELG